MPVFLIHLLRKKEGGGGQVKNNLADLKIILHVWFCNPPSKLFTKMVVRVISLYPFNHRSDLIHFWFK